jgi:hypothetical protein
MSKSNNPSIGEETLFTSGNNKTRESTLKRVIGLTVPDMSKSNNPSIWEETL